MIPQAELLLFFKTVVKISEEAHSQMDKESQFDIREKLILLGMKSEYYIDKINASGKEQKNEEEPV